MFNEMNLQNDRIDGIMNKAGHVNRALLIYVHTFPLSVASLRHIAQKLVAAGYEVDAFNAFSSIASYAPDINKAEVLLERLWPKYRRFILPAINGSDLTGRVDLSNISIPALPCAVSDLRSATAYGAKVGLAALSTAASYTQKAVRDKTAGYGRPLQDAWKVAHLAAAAAEQLRLGHDEVYIYNGRTAESRPFCDVLEETAAVFRHESGTIENSYFAFPGALHDPENVEKILALHPVDEQAGEDFFHRQRSRKPGTPSHMFTSKQVEGLLPEALADKKVVAMFTSSEDEFFAIKDDATFGHFPTQFEAAVAVASICRENGKTLALRMHPHLSIKDDHWKADWNFARLKALGAHVIMPHEPIDSYALVEASEIVITCGSTIGVEAAFYGKPSLVIGENFSTVLGICVAASREEDIAAFIEKPFRPARAREQAVAIGSSRQRFGEEIPGLTNGATPELARLDGRLMDPARYLIRRAERTFRSRRH